MEGRGGMNGMDDIERISGKMDTFSDHPRCIISCDKMKMLLERCIPGKAREI